MPKTFSNKSNAVRAAKKIEGATIEQQDGAWIVAAAPAEDEVAPKQIHEDTFLLASEDGGDYGMVRPADAREQAQRLANEEGFSISIRNPTTDEVVDTVEPEKAPEPEPEPEPDTAEPVLMELRMFVPANIATELAYAVSKCVGNPVAIFNPATGNRIGDYIHATDKPARAGQGPEGHEIHIHFGRRPLRRCKSEERISLPDVHLPSISGGRRSAVGQLGRFILASSGWLPAL